MDVLELTDEFCFGTIDLAVDDEGLPENRIARVTFPTLMLLDRSTPDGRQFASLGFEARSLPLPLMYKSKTTNEKGHHDAHLVGSLEAIELHDEGTHVRVSGWGYLVDLPEAHNALTAIRTKSIRGVSADLADLALDHPTEQELEAAPNLRFVARRSKLAALTIVPIPAFPEAFVELDLVASAHEIIPPVPTGYFENPRFSRPTGWTVMPVDPGTGFQQVFGHLALWDTCHVGKSGCVLVPKGDDFSYFKSGGTVLCDDGTMKRVGRVFLGGEHAVGGITPKAVLDHYAATSLGIADVVGGEDEFGVWVAGVLRPGLEGKLAYAARASAISGDWRRIDGQMHLLAVLGVNSPGFPVRDTGDAIVASGPPSESELAAELDLDDDDDDDLDWGDLLVDDELEVDWDELLGDVDVDWGELLWRNHGKGGVRSYRRGGRIVRGYERGKGKDQAGKGPSGKTVATVAAGSKAPHRMARDAASSAAKTRATTNSAWRGARTGKITAKQLDKMHRQRGETNAKIQALNARLADPAVRSKMTVGQIASTRRQIDKHRKIVQKMAPRHVWLMRNDHLIRQGLINARATRTVTVGRGRKAGTITVGSKARVPRKIQRKANKAALPKRPWVAINRPGS